MTCVLIDIGGTNTRVTVATGPESFVAPVTFATPSRPEAALERIESAVTTLSPDRSVDGVVLGIRGQLDDEKRMLRHDALLTAWVDFPLAATLAEQFQCSVHLENDTALAGLGEAMHGAGKGFDIVVYHSISTGVGGVRIDHQEIDHASIGFEPGHQVLDIDRTVLGEDIDPTLENLVSGTAIEKRMGVPAYEIPQDDVLWDNLAEYIGQGLRNSILYWSPEIIVLGGAMIVGDPSVPLDNIRRHTVASLDGFVAAPFITKATLGDHSGLYGALAYAAQQKLDIY